MKTFYFKNERDERFKFEFTDQIIDPNEMDEWLDAINGRVSITEDEYLETLKIEIRIGVYSESTNSDIGYLCHDRSLLPDDIEL